MITMEQIDSVIRSGPFSDDWDSLRQWRVPEWYRRCRFGIFIHWGVYSVPAYRNEWYPRSMYIQGSPEFEHHVRTWGPQKTFGYKDFIPLFRAEKFDPDAWAEAFRNAGAQYVIPVAEHHDGFQMYRSGLSRWNAWEMGPRRDVLGELKAAVLERNMVFGASSHRIEHWFFQGHGREFDSDIADPPAREDLYWPSMPDPQNLEDPEGQPAPSEEFLRDWLLRTCELIDVYQPEILYFDWWIMHRAAEPYVRKMAAYDYNRAAERGGEAVINYKHDAFAPGAAVPDIERGFSAGMRAFPWQADTSTALNSWCFTPQNEYRSSGELIRVLIDTVSKNGRLLLNVGPKADGTLAPQDVELLSGIGEWLKKNGEAVYGTRPWRIFGEGPTQAKEGSFSEDSSLQWTGEDFRFTEGDGAVYAFRMACVPGSCRIQALGRQAAPDLQVRGVRRVEDGKALPWRQESEGLYISDDGNGGDPAVYRIDLDRRERNDI